MSEKKITIRVYGIWINDINQLFITDEYLDSKYITKLPGGGLEFGESILECLKREWKEELDIEIEVLEHFYTTDFMQISIFNPNIQVISIYYLVRPLEKLKYEIKTKAFDFDKLEDGAQIFRFIDLEKLDIKEITLPTDQKALSILKNKYF
jgi:8-oxo-dGTP diphosphatase